MSIEGFTAILQEPIQLTHNRIIPHTNQHTSILTFNEYLERVNNAIKAIPYPQQPSHLYEPITYTMDLGGKRLRRLFREVSDLQELIADNDGSEGDMFRQFAEETHYNITPPTAEIDDDDSIKLRSIGRITGYFFWTLRDKFGFGKGRLKELSRVCGAIGDDLKEGRRTIQGMKDELNRIDGFWLGGRDAS